MLQELFDRVGRKGDSEGFTLIELLIVVVIIGILAAIAIPQFSSTKEKAYLASMKSDLRNMSTAQEVYFSENNSYASSVSDLSAYETSDGVTVTMASGTQNGWSATADHPGTNKGCGIYFGSATAPSITGTSPSTTTPGAPFCAE